MLLASSTSIQLAAAFATGLFARLGPGGAAGLSFLIAGFLLVGATRPRILAWPGAHRRDVAVMGVTIAVLSICFYYALEYLPLGTVVTIEFLGPLSVALVAVRRLTHLLAAVLALLGVVLVSSATPSGNLPGLALAAGAGAAWAVYIFAVRRAGRWSGSNGSVAVAMCVAAILTLPFSIDALPRLATAAALGTLLVIALLGKVLPLRLEFDALAELAPSTSSIVFSLEPAVAALVGALVLGQSLDRTQLFGVLAVVLAGILALRDSASDR
jgi:inner membrane transporter RhtA